MAIKDMLMHDDNRLRKNLVELEAGERTKFVYEKAERDRRGEVFDGKGRVTWVSLAEGVDSFKP